MADVKISALPASTTPLAGTEVLPIVQSSTTRQVSVANLTAGRDVSALSYTATGNLTFTGTGNRITGDFSNATVANRVAFQSSTTNGNTNITLIPNGTSVTSSVNMHANSDVDNASRGRVTMNSGGMQIFSDITGTGTYLPIIMSTGGSERLRIDTSGNVGIGTSSPATKLQVYGGALTVNDETTYAARFGNNSNKGVTIGYDTTNNVGHIGSINPAVAWTSLVINANEGNLGLCVTPSAWDTTRRAFQFGTATTFGNGALSGVQNDTTLTTNAYYNGAWKYQATGANLAATLYSQSNGAHVWQNAPTGAAGANITFTSAMTLDASGNLLVARTSSSRSARISVLASSAVNDGIFVDGYGSGICNGASFSSASATATAVEFLYNATTVGSITTTTAATAYVTTSDYRLKENVAPMTGALAKVAQLKPVTYKWKTDGSDGQGFIAHELAKVVPDCVTGEKDAIDEDGKPKYQAMDTSFLIATLTAAIQEQQALIESLTTRLTALENK